MAGNPGAGDGSIANWRQQQIYASHIAEYVLQMRKHNRLASERSAEWNKLNDEVNDLLQREGITDILMRARRKEANLGLAGAMDAWKFHKDEVLRFSSMIVAEDVYWKATHSAQ